VSAGDRRGLHRLGDRLGLPGAEHRGHGRSAPVFALQRLPASVHWPPGCVTWPSRSARRRQPSVNGHCPHRDAKGLLKASRPTACALGTGCRFGFGRGAWQAHPCRLRYPSPSYLLVGTKSNECSNPRGGNAEDSRRRGCRQVAVGHLRSGGAQISLQLSAG
jgi:hypothetical protein